LFGSNLLWLEAPRGEVEVIEPTVLGADPDAARAVEQQRVHRVDREALRSSGSCWKRDAAGAAIDPRQPPSIIAM
jgi:hypothetical protein